MKKAKNYILKTLSGLLVALTVIASVKWNVNVHYCGSEVINYSIVGEAEGCGMVELDKNCTRETQSPIGDSFNKTCCSNKDIVFKSDEQVRIFTELADYQIDLKFESANTSITRSINDIDQQHHFANLPPPGPQRDYQILYQVFLI